MCMEDFYAKVTPDEIHQWQVFYYTQSEEFIEWNKKELELEESKHMSGKEKIASLMASLGVKEIKK